MAELRSESMKTKKKKNLYRRKKPMWKEKIEREIERMRGELQSPIIQQMSSKENLYNFEKEIKNK